MEKQHGIVQDDRGQDQPTDKQRAQQSDLTEKNNPKNRDPEKSKRARGEAQTEDEMARAELGGTRGSPLLPDGGMTKSQREQTPNSNDPGHVA